MSDGPRPRLAVASLALLLVTPIAVQGITRVLAAWTGAPHDAPWFTLAALLIPALAGLVAVVRGEARPVVGWAAAALVGAVLLARTGTVVTAVTAALLAGALAAHGLRWLATVAPVPRGRVTSALWGVLAVLAVVQGARMSVFMADPEQRWGALAPTGMPAQHCCLTSYVHGAALAQQGANIYDDRYGSTEGPALLPGAIVIGPLTMDTYEYPPQFLVVPGLLLAITSDFLAIRALWFLLTAGIFLATVVVLARWLGGEAQRRVLLLAPAMWLSPPLLITAYFGNFQMMAMVLSALGMLAIFRGNTRRGAALLAFLIGAKIFPGILGMYLLAARRWAAAAWTAGFAVAYALLALLLFGPGPYVDFFGYHLPRLASGETFAFLSDPMPTMANFGVFGVPFKLRIAGWSGSEADAWALARPLSWAYTLLVVVVAVRAGWRRTLPTTTQGQVALVGGWLGLLALGALRSPFAPPEALVSVVLALALRAAVARSRRDVAICAALWVVALIVIPVPSPLLAIASLSTLVILYATAIWLALARDE